MTDQTSGVRQLELVIEGSRVPTGSIDLDTLAPLANGLLRALRAVAREQRGQPASRTGNPGRDIRVATGLRLVALRKGSTVLVWESAEVDLFGGVADETINQLLLRVGDEAAAIDTAVVEPLEEARRSLGEGGTIRFITAGKPPVVLDEDRIARLRGSSEQPVPALRVTHRTVTGWLHAADLEPNEIRIMDAENLDWICDFQSALRRRCLDAPGQSGEGSWYGNSNSSRRHVHDREPSGDRVARGGHHRDGASRSG